jgi:2-oxoglutarate dehydrogenase E2 component (dihydrolipoamide succinyltransferase)
VQPQSGILGVGAIEKRAVVISKAGPLEPSATDSLAFLPMTTLSFSYDHRVLDGATADAFCAAVKKALESYHRHIPSRKLRGAIHGAGRLHSS